MVPLVVVVVDEAADLPLQVPRERVVLQLDQVLRGGLGFLDRGISG
jgi:hypothetical protein